MPLDCGKLLELHGCLQVVCCTDVVPFFAFFSKHVRISPGMVSMWVCTASLFKFLVIGRPGFVWPWMKWKPEWEHDWKSLVPLKFWELSMIQGMVIDFYFWVFCCLAGISICRWLLNCFHPFGDKCVPFHMFWFWDFWALLHKKGFCPAYFKK